MTADVLNARGAEKATRGDRRGAFADFDAALALDPTLAAARNNRGLARLTAGDLDAAVADLREAVRLDPDYAAAFDNLAAACTLLRDYAGAVACHDRAIVLYTAARRQPRRLGLSHVLRALARHHLGHPGAVLDMRLGYRLAPRLAAATVAGAVASNVRTLGAAAVTRCDEYLARRPGDGFTVVHRGLTHLALGDRPAFAADFAAARWLVPPEDVAIAAAFARAVEARPSADAPPPGA